jgi:hypothetical protein
MPGVKGASGGHNRKRSDQKLGHAKTAKDTQAVVDKPTAAADAPQPDLVFPDGALPPLRMTQDLWDSMAVSGYNEFFTASDWAAAAVQMYALDLFIRDMLDKGNWRAGQMAEVRGLLADMMVMESARRKLRIEVQRPSDNEDLPDNVTPIQRAADMFGA